MCKKYVRWQNFDVVSGLCLPRRMLLMAALFLGVLALSETSLPSPVVAGSSAGREIIVGSYVREFSRSEPPNIFNGNIRNCDAGSTSEAWQSSILQRINWYRKIAGLPNVPYATAYTKATQAAALISVANGALSHQPASSVSCYSSEGYDGASHSNLFLGRTGLQAIDGYIEDPGDNNTKVGHRSWILSPTLSSVATGDIPSEGDSSSANALYVAGPAATRVIPQDGAVMWPPSGFVPDALVFPRWSYSRIGSDFSNAVVSVTGPNGLVTAPVETRLGVLDPLIGFVPSIPTEVTVDTEYRVRITGIGGVNNADVNYTVTIMHVALSGAEAVDIPATDPLDTVPVNYGNTNTASISSTPTSTNSQKSSSSKVGLLGPAKVVSVATSSSSAIVRWPTSGAAKGTRYSVWVTGVAPVSAKRVVCRTTSNWCRIPGLQRGRLYVASVWAGTREAKGKILGSRRFSPTFFVQRNSSVKVKRVVALPVGSTSLALTGGCTVGKGLTLQTGPSPTVCYLQVRHNGLAYVTAKIVVK